MESDYNSCKTKSKKGYNFFFIKWKDINDSSEWCYNSYKWYEWNDINNSGERYKW